jgi:predicted dehydrogenase
MTEKRFFRRDFLRASSVGGTSAVFALSARHTEAFAYQQPRSANSILGVAAIGLRYQGTVDTEKARMYGNIVACCDVDRHVREQARASFGSTPFISEDYREVLARKEVDLVIIGTPDHWHAKILIDACRAGKDVYCEKPLTLTIDEGKRLRDVVRETGRIVQVGSWQRSDSRFRLAVEMVRQGRIGKLQEVEVVLGKNEQGGPFTAAIPPKHLNWNLWQGQTPDVPYIEERSHYTFRWWLEYSGGQMTDWGAHHIDIAQWAIDSYPISIEGKAVFPKSHGNSYNVPSDYEVRYRYANDVVMTVLDNGRNGITFTGSDGRIFVNRGTIAGKAVDDLATKPLMREKFELYSDNLERPERAGKLDAIVNHMGNFFDCAVSRKKPISDIESQHRSVTTCHLGNIALKLGRKLSWDPGQEEFIDDLDANRLLSRQQRSGFEVS